MKKVLSKVALATLMAAAPLAASNYSFNTNSLFAVEGSFSSLDVSGVGSSGTYASKDFAGGGLKIGAESDHYRVFIGVRGYDIEDFSYAYSYGVDLDYKFNFSKIMNFFIGINGGQVDMSHKIATGTEKINEVYYGANLGFNYHYDDLIDLEFGAHGMKIDNFDNMVSGYGSVIIKYQMD